MNIFLKNKNFKSFFAGAILFPLLYACAVPFGPNDPVIAVGIEAHKDKYRGVTTQADRRLVLATKKEEEEITMVGPGEKESTTRKIPAMPIICAEPFPEGVALLDKLKKTTLELNDKVLGLEDKHTFNVSIPFASHPAIKFYRDGIFALCQAAMNGWVETKPQVRISANSRTTVIGFERWNSITKEDQTKNKDTNFYLNNNSLVIKIIESSMELDENEKEFLIELMEETRPGGRTRERLKLTAPPFISEFEFQLYRLREAAIRIFGVETEKEKAKAQQEAAKAQQEIAKARQEEAKVKQIRYQKCNTDCGNCNINCVDPG